MATEKNGNFWISYADLMTSLFFIMLVLFIIVTGRLIIIGGTIDCECEDLMKQITELKDENKDLKARLKKCEGEKEATEEQICKLIELFNIEKKVDTKYFDYKADFQRFTLRGFNAKFKTNSSDINDISRAERQQLLDIGKSLKKMFEKAKRDPITKDAQYVLIVEGQASKDGFSKNYELSYSRALSLVKYWVKNDIKFPNNCEVIISGSGQASQFRDKPDTPPKNQRFVIHIIPKPGKMPEINSKISCK